MNRIIAFYSQGSRTGKNTCAAFCREYLEEQGFEVSESGFADEAKLVCADALGVDAGLSREDRIKIIDRIKEEGQVSWRTGLTGFTAGKVSGREFIIGLCGDTSGEYGIRRLDQEFWIRQAINALPRKFDFHFFTDTRFHPEAKAIWNRGGLVVEVVRATGEYHNEDRIETNWTIDNSGSLDETRAQCRALMEQLSP